MYHICPTKGQAQLGTGKTADDEGCKPVRPRAPDSIDVGQGDLDALPARKVDTSDTCHTRLALALLVFGISRTDDSHHAFSADDLAVLADRFDAASNLHLDSPPPFIAQLSSLTSFTYGFKRLPSPWGRLPQEARHA